MDPTMMQPAGPEEQPPAPSAAMAPPADAPDQGAQGDQPNVTPQEQAQYDTVVTGALNTIFDEQGLKALIGKLGAGKDNLGVTIGHTGAMVLLSLKHGAEERGKDIPGEILFHAAQEVISSLCDVAVATQMMTEEQVPEVAKAALFEGLRVWGRQMQDNNEITDEDQASAKQQLDEKGIKQTPPGAAGPEQLTPSPDGQPAGPPQGIVQQGVQ